MGGVYYVFGPEGPIVASPQAAPHEKAAPSPLATAESAGVGTGVPASALADAQERDSDEADMPALEGVSSSDEDSQSDVGDPPKTPRRSGHGVPNASVQIPTPAPPVPVPRKPPEAGKQAGKPALEPVRKPLGAARINMAGPPAPD